MNRMRYPDSVRLCRLSAPALLALCTGTASAQVVYQLLPFATARVEHSWVFEPTTGRIIRFGGSVGTTFFNDTRAFDGAAWTTLSPLNSPSARGRMAMAFDTARGVMVGFGGALQGGTMSNETWLWDGTNWTRATPPTSPSARSGAAMAYDPVRQKIVLFGGWVPSGQDANDLWEWNGTTWNLLFTTSAPTARGAHRMVYDEARRVLVMFGGWRTPANGTLGDTWELNGTSWSQVTGPGPSNRCDPGMAFDPQRGRIMLFGGLTSFTGSTPNVIGDTWDYGANGWVQRTSTGPATARGYAEMVWHEPRSRLTLTGGMDANGARAETFAVNRPTAARSDAYGTACASSVGTPLLDSPPFTLPWLGDRFEVRIGGGIPGTTSALLWIGSSRTTFGGGSLPLDLSFAGLTGCSLLASMDVVVPLGVTNGSATVGSTLCGNCPSFVGRKLYFQALVSDPAAPRTFPAALTNGLELTIGN